MLADFLLDTLMLRQGCLVGETPALMHQLKLLESREHATWKKFLYLNVQPGDYIFPHDIANVMASEITRELRILDTVKSAVGRDQFNMELFGNHVDFFTTMQTWFPGDQDGSRAPIGQDSVLRHW